MTPQTDGLISTRLPSRSKIVDVSFPPPKEALGLLNHKPKETGIDDLAILLSPQKSASAIKRSISGSPARRIPRAISSPAKRNALARNTKALEPSITKSPSKRSLGSPLRKTGAVGEVSILTTSNVNRLHNSRILASPPCTKTRKTSAIPSGAASIVILHDAELNNKDQSKSINRPSSPLKRPAQRMHDKSPTSFVKPNDAFTGQAFSVTIPTSPLKKPPFRPMDRASPRKDTGAVRQRAVLLNLSASVDEISLPATTKQASNSDELSSQTKTTESRLTTPDKTRRASLSRFRAQTSPSPESPVIEDEIVMSYTPIKIPEESHFVHSPPSEDTIEGEEDLWMPSVPISLTRSFSQLRLDSRERPSQATEDTSMGLPDTPKSNTAAELVVYVDCRSTENMNSSEHFSTSLTELGAKTLKRWNWNPETQRTPSKRIKVGLTHVVFFGGSVRTLKKVKEARKLGIHVECVGLSWVAQCKTSQRLTIGVAGHEVDVEAELIKLATQHRKSMEPRLLITPEKPTSVSLTAEPQQNETQPKHQQEYSCPVKFDDGSNIFSTTHFMPARPSTSISSIAPEQESIPHKLTELEIRQLALARRDSAKFRPPISSPLSKKAWRA